MGGVERGEEKKQTGRVRIVNVDFIYFYFHQNGILRGVNGFLSPS